MHGARLTCDCRGVAPGVAQQFAASFDVAHSDGDDGASYSGSLVKTLDAQGEWVVSGSLTITSPSNPIATTYTLLDDKGYYQVGCRGTCRARVAVVTTQLLSNLG